MYDYLAMNDWRGLAEQVTLPNLGLKSVIDPDPQAIRHFRRRQRRLALRGARIQSTKQVYTTNEGHQKKWRLRSRHWVQT